MLEEAVQDLRGRTRGEVIEPADDGYEAAREAYNAMATGRPAIIFRPADLTDIVTAVRWAAGVGSPDRCPRWWPQRRRPLVPRRGAAHRPVPVAGSDGRSGYEDGGRARWVPLDGPRRRHLRLRPGRAVRDVHRHRHRRPDPERRDQLAPVASEGFACDALIGAQLVTADGDVLEVDEKRDPELLWGLRGGGGNFGVVTRLRYALTEVPAMFGGRLRFRGDALRDAILRTFEVEASAPDELVLAIVAWRDEDGSPSISVNVGWRGDPESGMAAVRALATHPACYESDLKPMNWLQQQTLYQPIPFGLRQYWKGHLIGRLDESLADALIASASEATMSRSRSSNSSTAGSSHPRDAGRVRRSQRVANGRPSRSGRTRPTTRPRSPGPAASPIAFRRSRSEVAVTSTTPSWTRRRRALRPPIRRTRGLDFDSSSSASIPRTASGSTRTSRPRTPEAATALVKSEDGEADVYLRCPEG